MEFAGDRLDVDPTVSDEQRGGAGERRPPDQLLGAQASSSTAPSCSAGFAKRVSGEITISIKEAQRSSAPSLTSDSDNGSPNSSLRWAY
jgi:hypothetical protein